MAQIGTHHMVILKSINKTQLKGDSVMRPYFAVKFTNADANTEPMLKQA